MFSAVIPLFNKRPWIRRALDSVVAQDFPCAEVIVVNDGSTDGGDAVVRGWGDPRLRIIDQPNQGVSAACNAGIAAATSPWVAFLDADDEWTPSFLGRMRSLVEQHPDAVLYGSGFVACEDGHGQRRHGVTGAAASGGPVDFFREISRDTVMHRSSTVVSRAAALAVGGFPPGVQCFEDYIFWIKLALAGRFVITPEPLVRYDVAVPGQLLAVWREGNATSLAPTDLDRFLAEELHRRSAVPQDSPTARSFAEYARRHLAVAVLTRAYWGRFEVLERMWHDLRLSDLSLGWPAGAAGWAARHPATYPLLRMGLAAVRPVRQALLRGLRKPSA